MSVEVRKRLFTVEEFHRMGDAGVFDHEARLELWAGEIYEMPPIGPPHQGDVNALTAQFTRALGDRAVVSVQGPVTLDDLSEPQPDLLVLRPREDFYRSAHPRPEDVLLLVEVSDSSLRWDRSVKLPRYGAVGIPETWILDVAAHQLEVHRAPSPDGYATTSVLAPGETASPQAFPDIALLVTELLG